MFVPSHHQHAEHLQHHDHGRVPKVLVPIHAWLLAVSLDFHSDEHQSDKGNHAHYVSNISIPTRRQNRRVCSHGAVGLSSRPSERTEQFRKTRTYIE